MIRNKNYLGIPMITECTKNELKGAYKYTLPEHFALQKVYWQIFGTLTFDKVLREGQRIKLFRVLLGKSLKKYKVYIPEVLWLFRQEEILDSHAASPHFHFLIAGLPVHPDHKLASHPMEAIWPNIGGGKQVRIQPYDHNREGVKYVLKCPKEKYRNAPIGSNLQENCGLMLSHSLQKYLKERK